MHQFKAHGVTFNSNGDLSGDVVIVTKDGRHIEVSGKALLDFMADFVMRRAIAKLEQATTEGLLGL